MGGVLKHSSDQGKTQPFCKGMHAGFDRALMLRGLPPVRVLMLRGSAP